MDERADTLIRPYMEPKEGFNYNAAAPSTKVPKYLAYAEDEMLIDRASYIVGPTGLPYFLILKA